MTETPTTHYAKSDGVYIAYQVVGEGPFDLLFVPGFVSNIEAIWQSPDQTAFFRRSGLAFEDRGTHVLKGVPNKWRLFRALVE